MTTVELSRAERQVVLGVAYGLSFQSIASRLAMRLEAVRGLMALAKGKLGDRDMPDAAAIERAYKAGALPDPPPDGMPVRLTPSQITLVWLVSLGMTIQEIVIRSAVPAATVERDLVALCAAVGAQSPPHLITRARQLRIPYHRRLPHPARSSRRRATV
ncbi:hypothetical protein [Streptomyces sp. NPDC059080]|uniref:hypothetical protein n=1 Tax=Streptomyces sp. NPDC059080 TaxID=3346718 RepID=UPI0036959C0B